MSVARTSHVPWLQNPPLDPFGTQTATKLSNNSSSPAPSATRTRAPRLDYVVGRELGVGRLELKSLQVPQVLMEKGSPLIHEDEAGRGGSIHFLYRRRGVLRLADQALCGCRQGG